MSKKFSSFDQQQLIMENFRKFINEEYDWDDDDYDDKEDLDRKLEERAAILNDLANGKPADMEIYEPRGGKKVSLGAGASPEDIKKWLLNTAELMDNDRGAENEIKDFDVEQEYLDGHMEGDMKETWNLIKQKFENGNLG